MGLLNGIPTVEIKIKLIKKSFDACSRVQITSNLIEKELSELFSLEKYLKSSTIDSVEEATAVKKLNEQVESHLSALRQHVNDDIKDCKQVKENNHLNTPDFLNDAIKHLEDKYSEAIIEVKEKQNFFDNLESCWKNLEAKKSCITSKIECIKTSNLNK